MSILPARIQPSGLVRCGFACVMISLLSACATLSEPECRHADWARIGREDGRQGYPASRLESHREACAEYGIRPHSKVYREAHDQGVREYCTPARGYRAGRSGHSYQDVCPPDLEDDFLDAYREGHRLYQIESRIQSLISEQQALERKLDKAKNDHDRREIRQALRRVDRELSSERTALRMLELRHPW